MLPLYRTIINSQTISQQDRKPYDLLANEVIPMFKPVITPDLVGAYGVCKRKAFLLLEGNNGAPHEYERLINARAADCRMNLILGPWRPAVFRYIVASGSQ